MASVAEEHRWVDSWQKYHFPLKDDSLNPEHVEDIPFPYLKCQKGAGELLKTWSGDVVKSAAFWESLIVLILVGGIAALYFFGKRDKLYRNDHKGLETGFNQRAPRRPLCILRILLMLILNGLLAVTLSFSAISLIEIKAHPQYSEGMQHLTPACSDPAMVCPTGNRDIDNQSAQWPPFEGADTMQPFSYIIASDAQLYWFNGEFAEMGRKTMPPSCRPSDSCGKCTDNHGMKTNLRLQKAWESLMTGKTDGMNASHANLPIPKTLVMNGEL